MMNSLNRGALRSFTLLLCLIGILSVPVFAQGEVIILPLERQLQTDQRGIVTLRFELENTSGNSLVLQEALHMPPDWSLITTPAPFSLAAGERSLRLLHLVIPRNNPAGQFPLQYQLDLHDSGLLVAHESIRVTVAEIPGLSLARLSVPANLLPGESYEARFLLRNTGNTRQTYRIKLRNADGYAHTAEPRQIELEAGGQQTLTIKGQAAPVVTEDIHRFTVIVSGQHDRAEETVQIPLIQAQTRGVGGYKLLYGELRTGYGLQQTETEQGEETQQTGTLDYTLRGTLDDAGKHRIDLQLGTQKMAGQTEGVGFERYQARYGYHAWELKAGQQNFFTSRLSGNSLSGTGFELRYQSREQPGTSVRVFHGSSREESGEQEQLTGMGGQHRLDTHPLELAASVVHHEKTLANGIQEQQDILGLETRWAGENLDLSLAMAHDGQQQAVAMDGSTRWGDVSSSLSYLRSDAGFKGANPDTEQTHLGSQWQVSPTTRVSAQLRQSRNNLDNDESRQIREDNEQQLRVDHTLGAGGAQRMGLALRHRQERDKRSRSTLDQELTQASLRYQRDFDTLTLAGEWSAGKRTDHQQDADGQMASGQQLTARWQPSRQWKVSAEARHDRGIEGMAATDALGIQGEYVPDEVQRVSASLQTTRSDNAATTLGLNYQRDLRKGRKLNLRLGHTQSRDNDGKSSRDNSVQVDIRMPLDLPLRRRTDIATLCGQLRYAGQERAASASGMVLMLGQYTAITDPDGKFCYPDILAITYQLQLDTSRLQGQSYLLGSQGHQGELLAISLKPGEKRMMDIALHPAAGITGQLLNWVYDPVSDRLQPGAGVPGLVIELRRQDAGNDQAPRVRVSDAQGHFSLLGLPAGRWQLSVTDTERLPANTRLEHSLWQINLSAGQTEQVIIRVLPKEQGIERTGPASGFSLDG